MIKRITIKLLLTAIFLLFSVTIAVLASGGGDGSGGGGGDGSGGANHPELVQSSIRDGQADVSVNVTIDLVFSNNVVHFSIAENNKRSFAMTDEHNAAIPIDVIMGDEQIDPSIRRNISVKPSAPLEYGTRYTLVIQRSLVARNGNAMAADVTLSFTTESGPAPPPPDEPVQTPEPTEAPSPHDEPPEGQAPPEAPEQATTPPEGQTTTHAETTMQPDAPPDDAAQGGTAETPDAPAQTPRHDETTGLPGAQESAQENQPAQNDSGTPSGGDAEHAQEHESRLTMATYIVLALAVVLVIFALFYFRDRKK